MPRTPRTSDPDELHPYTISSQAVARGYLQKGKPTVGIRFPNELFTQLREEAIQRRMSLNALVIELIRVGLAPED